MHCNNKILLPRLGAPQIYYWNINFWRQFDTVTVYNSNINRFSTRLISAIAIGFLFIFVFDFFYHVYSSNYEFCPVAQASNIIKKMLGWLHNSFPPLQFGAHNQASVYCSTQFLSVDMAVVIFSFQESALNHKALWKLASKRNFLIS